MLLSLFEKFRLKLRMFRAGKRRRSARFFEKELFLLEFLVDGGTALDIGANKGLYSSYLALWADKVIAIEPNPVLARKLRYALPGNCTVMQVAVSDKKGLATLNIPISKDGKAGYNTASLEEVSCDHTQQVEVETLTVDALKLEDVRFLKIDVEGHEESVLKGAKNTIEKQRPIVLMEANETASDKTKALFAYFDDLDYVALQMAGNQLISLTRDPGTLYYRNIVFMPKVTYDRASLHDE